MTREDRVAVQVLMMVVLLIVFAAVLLRCAPAEASPACMTKVEARAAFRTSHLYWHGAGHCWNATAGRQQHHVRHHEEPRHREVAAPIADAAEPIKPTRLQAVKVVSLPSNEVAKINMPVPMPAWTNAMAAIPMPGEEATLDWVDRWQEMKPVQIVQSHALAHATADADAPLVSPRDVIMAIVLIGLSFAVFDVVFGGVERKQNRRDGYFT